MAETAATQSPRIVPLDPRDPTTWKNIPCPDDLTGIQAELTRIGGTNKFGEPNFLIVWAQEYRTFDLGKMRIHFDEEAIDAIHTPNRWAVRADVFTRAASWLEQQNQARQRAYMNLDWDSLNDFADVGDYLRGNELPENYFKLPSDEENLGRLARLLPDGWMYIEGLWDYEHIGQQCYYVLQWYPPEAFGTLNEKAWQELRYDSAYVPETNREEALADVLGPFPGRGGYEGVAVRICDMDVYMDDHPVEIGKKIPRQIYRYKQPTIDYVCERVQELLSIRDTLSDEEKDPIARNKKRFEQFREEQPVKEAAWRSFFRERFNDAKPVGGGNPTNISSNKAKFDS
jgi:hypothetical protein